MLGFRFYIVGMLAGCVRLTAQGGRAAGADLKIARSPQIGDVKDGPRVARTGDSG